MDTPNKHFPKNFLWGTATAAHQVEGDNIKNEWWSWEKTKKGIPLSGKATNHYSLYKKDFDLIKDVLNNNAHRLSIEWARIEPENGKIDTKEIEHYRKVFEELRKRKIKIMLTLNHFTHPIWFIKAGGWEKRTNVKYFVRFAELVLKEYGDYVDYWCIINEPNIYSVWSYIKGFWPPEKTGLIPGLKVYLNLAHAHRLSYDLIHKSIPTSTVGSAINMTYFKGGNFIEKIAAKILTFIINYSFIWLSGKYDYIGINSYFFKPIKISDIWKFKDFKKDHIFSTLNGNNDLGWLVYPQGIYHTVVSTWQKYKIPIIITENGTADAKDRIRPQYILDNLTWLKAAIDEGAEVLGYFHWTLMDNIEWTFGKRIRFGLFETDYKTYKRIPRKSAKVFAYISKHNSVEVPKSLLRK